MLRIPYNELPITLVNKAMQQKVFRQLHCMECGQPFAEITDKIVVVYDGGIMIEKLLPDAIGLIDIMCHRHQCKQHYRLEFAI